MVGRRREASSEEAPPDNPLAPQYLVAFSVRALQICVVVASLYFVIRQAGNIAACRAAEQQPVPAPTALPATAFAAALSAAACPALVTPNDCCAYCCHAKPMAWKWSKLLFVPGRTMTLGPLGT